MANLILQASDWPHKSRGGYSDKNAYSPVLFQSSSSVGACICFSYCNQNTNSFTNTLSFLLLFAPVVSSTQDYQLLPLSSLFHLAQIQTHPLPGAFQQRSLLLSHYFCRTLCLVLPYFTLQSFIIVFICLFF